MSSLRSGRRARAISLILVGTMLLPLTPGVITGVWAQSPARTVLLFPVTDESGSGVPGLGKMATDCLHMAVDGIQEVECTLFARSSPLVRRATAEGRILATQVEMAQRVGAREAISIGHALGVDAVILAGIQSYRSMQEPRCVEVILSGRMYEVAPNYDAEQGEVKPTEALTPPRAFGVAGVSRCLPGYQGSDRMLAREALDDAAYRVAKVLSGASVAEVSKPKPPAKRRNTALRTIGVVLAVGLIAWAVSSSGDDDGPAPGADAVPPGPLPLIVETDTIRIAWTPPAGTSLTVLRYQLQRSVNNGPWSYFGTGGISSNIDANATQYPDFDVASGNSYSYRIRAIYTNSRTSPWVEFRGVTL